MPAVLLQVWLRLAELRQGWPSLLLSWDCSQHRAAPNRRQHQHPFFLSLFTGERRPVFCLVFCMCPEKPHQFCRALVPLTYTGSGGASQDVAKLMCWQTGRGIKGCLITEQEGMSVPQQQSLGGGVSFLVLSKTKARPSSHQAAEQCSMLH